MNRTLLLLFACWLYFANALTAQKRVTEDEQLWFGVFNQTRFTDRWGIWADLHLRFRDQFAGKVSQGIARAGLTYYLSDDVRLTAAYAYVHHYPAEGHLFVAQPEHRPWQQLQWFTRFPGARLMQWVRLEERFRRKILDDNTLDEGYNFNYRIRYNFALFIPLTKKGFAPGSLQLLLNDEIMINFGENIVYNYFDQNRFFAGFAYQTAPHAHIQAGYMNLFQQLPAGNAFKNQHTIRIFYFHNLDLRKQKTTH